MYWVVEIGPKMGAFGDEAQRLKLAAELEERGNIYVLDEPTSGLHPTDVHRLLRILNRLVDRGNSVILIEHDVETLASCDWLIDMGPSGGEAGGYESASRISLPFQ